MLSCNGCGYKLLGEVFELLLHLKKDAGYNLYERKWCCINTLYQSEWIITETLEGHMQILLEITNATALCLYLYSQDELRGFDFRIDSLQGRVQP